MITIGLAFLSGLFLAVSGCISLAATQQKEDNSEMIFVSVISLFCSVVCFVAAILFS